jgi:uncharacterized protein (DUF488 family)
MMSAPEKIIGEIPDGTLFTVGHSTRPITEFTALLAAYGIEMLIDIRTMPRSRYNPQFNGEALEAALAAQNIGYRWMKALGGLRRAHKDSPNTGFRNGGFRGYADYMRTEPFAQALAELIAFSGQWRVAIMCAESVPWRCHRSLVADALTVRGVPVVHILSLTQTLPHALTAFAQTDGTLLTYPAAGNDDLFSFAEKTRK